MATSKQEQLYNEIVEYYSFADRLIKTVEDGSHELSGEEFAIAEEITANLEEYADKLANCYIEYIKGGQSEKIIASVRDSLNNISSKIEECKVKISALHNN
ncbi:MAG: hypothetical protein ISQ34_03205 [Rickettsiales bacterium]|nr:hypothetical protein [Rickettsiales bacterium]